MDCLSWEYKGELPEQTRRLQKGFLKEPMAEPVLTEGRVWSTELRGAEEDECAPGRQRVVREGSSAYSNRKDWTKTQKLP